ncbi:sterol desaturase family protein [Synechococcus sp. PCC 6312]|uniref:sterol desaturase family protein n=1 Tax=Synechococcus sp. (strain ATCC 27167 / PCC 6312) TaxID=195253 RepID=UPI0002DCD209|nr:sterol desaturase family protein [Synechococcus sp. PCC 6312]
MPEPHYVKSPMIPYTLSQPDIFGIMVGVMFGMVVVRFLAVAGVFAAFAALARRTFWRHRWVNLRPYKKHQFCQELAWSLLTSGIFALTGAITAVLWQWGYTAVYVEIGGWGYLYFVLSLLIALLVHETYYYWLHRWMHHPKIYPWMHKVHHQSITTSAWTAFSFHPLEALAQALFLPILVFVLPLHPYAIVILLTVMTFSSVINHLNLELYPAHFNRHWLGRFLIGATHHSLHHSQFRYNFGLYFTFWDHLMGTESETYNALFDQKTQVITPLPVSLNPSRLDSN